MFYQARAQYIQALDYLIQASKVEEAITTKNLLAGSEYQNKQFLNLFQERTDSKEQASQTLRDGLVESEQLFAQLANLSSRPLPDDLIQRQNIQKQQVLDKPN